MAYITYIRVCIGQLWRVCSSYAQARKKQKLAEENKSKEKKPEDYFLKILGSVYSWVAAIMVVSGMMDIQNQLKLLFEYVGVFKSAIEIFEKMRDVILYPLVYLLGLFNIGIPELIRTILIIYLLVRTQTFVYNKRFRNKLLNLPEVDLDKIVVNKETKETKRWNQIKQEVKLYSKESFKSKEPKKIFKMFFMFFILTPWMIFISILMLIYINFVQIPLTGIVVFFASIGGVVKSKMTIMDKFKAFYVFNRPIARVIILLLIFGFVNYIITKK
jgi:hypothetical protein